MGGKSATSTSKVTIPPEVMARYNAVNARAEKAAATPYEKYGNSPTDFVAQMNAQQGAGINTINASGGPAYQNIDKYMSPYIKNVADTTGAMMRQQQEQAQSGALGNAISSGAFGGDRAGIAAANLQQQNQMAYGNTMANIYNQGYTQALGASQADLGRQLQTGQMQMAAGTMQQQTEQAGKDAMIKQFMQEKGYPFQVAQYLANIAMGTGALSGSTTTATQPLGIFGNLATGGRVGKEGGGGVAGPMSDSQSGVGDEGYVPAGVLPVGQLMVSDPPEQQKNSDGSDAIMQLAMKAMGAKRGGVIDARHGYATDGAVGLATPEQVEAEKRRMEAERLAASGQNGVQGPAANNNGTATLGARPTGVAAPRAEAADPVGFFNTRVIRQESGGHQTDRNGNPLTSPAGAVGVAQVMEGTGPEAAKLAGLEWDRDRWLHDADYNKQIGQAYFLDQYRKFGSLDKAAAAYNAGPGALSQAMDRATALGGSYLDYLPAETQNYVKATTGSGGGGVSGPNQITVSTSGQPGGVAGDGKAYEDRNFIGKFFHDPSTGKLNPIALKSVLGGLASMAKSNTVSPISALLQGLGGGMETYNTLQNQEPTRVAGVMANSRKAREDYLTARALGETRPFEDWASSQYGSGPASMFGAPQTQMFSPQQFGQIDIMGNGLSQNITLANGTVVQGGQNYAYLTKLANDLQPYVAANVPAAVATMQAVQDRLNDIRTQQGFVQDVNGQQVKDPTYTATLDAQSRTGFGREQTLEFEKKAIEGQKRVDQDLEMIQHQADVFTNLPAGALANDKAAAGAILQSLGLPAPEGASERAAAVQEAMKTAAQKLLNSIGTDAPAAEMDQLKLALESPNMEPGAIKTILSMQKAQALREKDYYALRSAWNAENPDKAMDQSAYEAWFAENHGFGKYFEDAKKSMPTFAGELGSKQKPYQLSMQTDEAGNFTQADRDFENLPPGAYFMTPDGIIKQKPRG
jgi:hypothetical protein